VIIAAVPEWVLDAGAVAGVGIAIVTVLTLGYRLPPVRWLVRAIREDMAEHRCAEITTVLDQRMPGYLTPILYELRPNGGLSFRDRVMGELAEGRRDRAEIRRRLDEEIARVKDVEQEVIANRGETS
jgi:hypothetical protein